MVASAVQFWLCHGQLQSLLLPASAARLKSSAQRHAAKLPLFPSDFGKSAPKTDRFALLPQPAHSRGVSMVASAVQFWLCHGQLQSLLLPASAARLKSSAQRHSAKLALFPKDLEKSVLKTDRFALGFGSYLVSVPFGKRVHRLRSPPSLSALEPVRQESAYQQALLHHPLQQARHPQHPQEDAYASATTCLLM